VRDRATAVSGGPDDIFNGKSDTLGSKLNQAIDARKEP
jgi:hypothetical protein